MFEQEKAAQFDHDEVADASLPSLVNQVAAEVEQAHLAQRETLRAELELTMTRRKQFEQMREHIIDRLEFAARQIDQKVGLLERALSDELEKPSKVSL